ncbi:DUF805 domain-containing protein [Propionimicrobium sp. PCR01-08-3]|uniref:DUF805 domain-containing protein n=1 Tax=Propionimicrobium sp. PCR01-08-3 TaxID=3052086 RepID=UPI00255CB411|nr:DUF805 domain-containing protein [Propionimicrobium sp. PCR01-08-3]WIY83139.1 DUF805 domain-containing protein [Propionimicrobium sp. PCR01-08-3]
MNNIIDSLKYTLSKYIVFDGRASRAEWGTWVLSCFVINFVLGILVNLTMNANGNSPFTIVVSLFGLAILLPSITVSVRRLHDTGKSGLLVLLNLIPFIGQIIVLILCLMAPTPGPNQYGAPVTNGASAY